MKNMDWDLNRERRYDRNYIKHILKEDNLTKGQKKALKDFNIFKTNNNVGVNSRSMYLSALKQFFLNINKEPDLIQRKDIEKYLYKIRNLSEHTKTFKKIVLKNFFQWFYKCEKGQYPEQVRWLNTSLKSDPTLFRGKQDLLTSKEIERLLDACENQRDRSMIMIMLEWGLRASSIKNLSIKDVKDENGYLSLFIRGKGNTSGELTLFDSTPDLKAWLKIHKFKDQSNSPLFYTFRGKVGSRLTTPSIYSIVKRTSKKAKLKKNVFSHLLRHQALSRKGKIYTNQELKIIAL